MSAAATPARRLLALLEEERSLETRPAEEIHADLAALGVDPDGPIRLARRMAERGPDPAAALLDAVIEDEVAEADIAAVESADIDQIRARLQTGTVAAVTAEAQRRAGTQTNVVGIHRRRRGAVWAWTGSIVGMAACALIVVAVWWPSSDLAPSPSVMLVERAAPESPAAERIAAGRSPEATADFADPDPSEQPAPGPAVAPSGDDRARLEGGLGAAVTPPPELTAAAPQPAMRALSEEPVRPQLRSRIAPGADMPAEADAAGRTEAEDAMGSAGIAPRAAIPLAIEDLDESFDPPLPPLPPSTPAERRSLGDLALEMPTEAGAESAATTPSRVEIPSIEDLIVSFSSGSAGSMRGLRVDVGPPGPVLSPEVAELPYVVADLALFVPWQPDLGEIREAALLVMADDALQNGIGDWPGAVLGRRADALRIADGMVIHALMTLRSGGSDRDTILVRKQTTSPPLADESLRPLLVHWFGNHASAFALIRLPDR